jgi:hypothetical protein
MSSASDDAEGQSGSDPLSIEWFESILWECALTTKRDPRDMFVNFFLHDLPTTPLRNGSDDGVFLDKVRADADRTGEKEERLWGSNLAQVGRDAKELARRADERLRAELPDILAFVLHGVVEGIIDEVRREHERSLGLDPKKQRLSWRREPEVKARNLEFFLDVERRRVQFRESPEAFFRRLEDAGERKYATAKDKYYAGKNEYEQQKERSALEQKT